MFLPTITLEEHFISAAVRSSPSVAKLALHQFPPEVLSNLVEIGPTRIKNMDEGGVTLQVISHTPAQESLETCKQANQQLADAVKAHPFRFKGFAALPMAEPEAAALELKRCVMQYGFVGALIPNQAKGTYFDGEAYNIFWETAQRLDVPIYLHPAPPAEKLRQFHEGNYADAVAQLLSTQGWGWHADVALHILRLYMAGVFDKFPKVKVVIGHMGEMLPFMVDRIEARFSENWGSKERGWMTVWNENLWITTSGMFTLGPFACLIKTVKPDRILYSVDYPLEDNKDGQRFLEKVQETGWLTETEMKMFTYQNAEKLLQIQLAENSSI